MKLFKNFFKRLNDESGQSVIEYSLLSFMILGGGVIFLPAAIDKIITAYHIYIGSYYYVISMPLL